MCVSVPLPRNGTPRELGAAASGDRYYCKDVDIYMCNAADARLAAEMIDVACEILEDYLGLRNDVRSCTDGLRGNARIF